MAAARPRLRRPSRRTQWLTAPGRVRRSGTVLGGGAGLLAGLGMLAIPGIGPVVAAGWLVATALGAGVGAASGGLLGSLIGAGVAETDAHTYAEGVRRGGTLVTVRAEGNQSAMVEAILAKHAAVDIGTGPTKIAGAAGAASTKAPRPTPRGGSASIGSTPPTARRGGAACRNTER